MAMPFESWFEYASTVSSILTKIKMLAESIVIQITFLFLKKKVKPIVESDDSTIFYFTCKMVKE